MNLFYTNSNPLVAAKEHSIRHQIKMILETAQLLSADKRVREGSLETVYTWFNRPASDKSNGVAYYEPKAKQWYTLESDTFEYNGTKKFIVDWVIYAATHVNHPSAVWIRESSQHHKWAVELAFELCRLYKERTGAEHGCYRILDMLRDCSNSDNGFKPPYAAVDADLIELVDSIGTEEVYRKHVLRKFPEWLLRDKPLSAEFYKEVPEWVLDSGLFEISESEYNPEIKQLSCIAKDC